jgi:hypothetical protein
LHYEPKSTLAIDGRHLVRNLEQRAVARGFATIARLFGTATIGTIRARVQRGPMRAIALESILTRRALRGGDPRIPGAARSVSPCAADETRGGGRTGSGIGGGGMGVRDQQNGAGSGLALLFRVR